MASVAPRLPHRVHALGAYLPVVVALGYLLSRWLDTEILYLGVALLCMGVVMAYNRWSGSLPCPRCHWPFFRNWRYQSAYANTCAHCGLPKWVDF